MTDWSSFNYVREVLVTYFFGSVLLFNVFIFVVMLLFLQSKLQDLRYSFVFSFAFLVGMSLAGELFQFGWIIYLALIVMGALYTWAVLKVMS